MTDLIALAHEHCRAVVHYEGHQDGYEFTPDGLDAFAARIAKAPEDAVVPLAWSDPTPPADSCPYDHCKATTPFGPILITWKGWKDHPSFFADTFPCADGYLSLAAGNVEDAKQEAEAAYRALVRASLPPAHQAGGEGELLAEIERLKIRGAAYEEAFGIAYQATYQSHNGHWDSTMRGGLGCPECIGAREARANCDAAIQRGLQALIDRAAPHVPSALAAKGVGQ